MTAWAPATGQEPQSPRAGRRERTKASNRAAILNAARGVFAELGYGQATVRDVIRRTELASGTFYNYFPDKESVLRALVEDGAAEIRRRLTAARAGASTLEQFVEGGFRAYFEYIAEDRPTFELTRRNAGTIRELIHEPAMYAGVSDLLGDLDAAMKRGDMPAIDLGYMTAAMTGVGVEVGIVMVERDPVDIEGATEFATELFLAAIERLASSA